MAVAYRSSTQHNTDTYSGGSITLTEPTGAASGDYLIAVAWQTEGDTSSDPLTMSSDWTRLHSNWAAQGTSSLFQQHIWYHERGGSAPASFVVTKNGGQCSVSGSVIAVSGAAAGQVPNVSAVTSDGDVTNVTCDFDTLDSDCLVVTAFGTNEGFGTGDFDSTATIAENLGIVESLYHGPMLTGYDDPAAATTTTYTFDGPDSSVYVGAALGLYGSAPDYAAGDNGYVVSMSTKTDGNYEGGSKTITPEEPAGAAEGDILVALVATSETSTGPTIPSGWTSLSSGAMGGDGHYNLCYIERGASAPALGFSRSGGGAGVHMYCVRGCRTFLMEHDVASGTTASLTTSAIDCSEGGAVLGFGAFSDGVTINQLLDCTTTDFVFGSNTHNNSGWGVAAQAHLVGTPSATQTVTFGRNASAGPNGIAALVWLPIATTNVTVEVHKTTGDYSTIQSAIDDCSVGISDGWYKVEIQDAAEYAEDVDINLGEITTPSATHYLWLTVAEGVRHSGVAGTGHARMKTDPSTSAIVMVYLDYTVVEWLDIELTGTGVSDECIRLIKHAGDRIDGVIIQNCILHTATAHGSQGDGIYIAYQGKAVDVTIANCIIYGFDRFGIHQQNETTTSGGSYHLFHNTVYSPGEVGEGVKISMDNNSVTTFTNNLVHNNLVFGDSGANCTVNGADNVYDFINNVANTDNLTGSTLIASANWVDTTQTSGSYVVVNETASGSEDMTLLDTAAGNYPVGNGTAVSGALARVNLAIDVAGNVRPTTGAVDIGAFQIPTPSAPALPGGKALRLIRSIAIR